MSSVRWLPFKEATMRSAGLRAEDRELLSVRGLPDDSNRMFVRDPRRELEVRELADVGAAAFLGDFEDGVNSYWLSVSAGSVWMKKGYGLDEGDVSLANTTLRAFQEMLRIWEEFVFSGVHEESDAYELLVEWTLAKAEERDPVVFEDEESWWARVFEEVELGSLAPE
ncbi:MULTISPECIES: SUKH-4 family immunity protein [Streptomyces]|uniref:SUKH-4 family immunity protein n=1 Tax=Streptomyces TaxID=1883 RepID=UPI00315C6480